MRTLAVSVLLVAAALATAAAKEIVAASSPSSVTVYMDKALIHRSATVALPAGNSTVAFPSLTSDLDDASARVSGSGSARVSILEVKVEREYLSEAEGKELRRLQARLDTLNAALQQLSDRATIVEAKKDFVLALKTNRAQQAAQRLGAQKFNAKDFEDLLAFVDNNLTKFDAELHALDARRAKAQDTINAVNGRMNDLRSQQNKLRKRIIVRADAADACTMTFDCSYVVAHASWQPLYDARIAAAEKTVALTYYGMVRQSTGEEWDNVRLTLSTAQPARGDYIPKLAAWYVRPWERPVYFGGGQGPEGIREDNIMAKPRERTEDNALFPATPRIAEIVQHELSADFTIADPATIPSDGQEHKTVIAAPALGAALEYVAVPRLSSGAFLRVKAANTAGAPLLAGNANVFLDDQFVSTTAFPATVPGDSLAFAAGTNDAIGVERKLVKKYQEYKGLLSKTYKWDYEFLTTITNKSAAAIAIEVQDQIPVSQNEKIVVQAQSVDPQAPPDGDNIYTWRFTLPQGAKQEIRLKYTVEYPRDMRVAGLE